MCRYEQEPHPLSHTHTHFSGINFPCNWALSSGLLKVALDWTWLVMSSRTWTSIHGGACCLLLVLCTCSYRLDLIIYTGLHRSWPACKRATKTLKFLKMRFHKCDWETEWNVPLRSSLKRAPGFSAAGADMCDPVFFCSLGWQGHELWGLSLIGSSGWRRSGRKSRLTSMSRV